MRCIFNGSLPTTIASTVGGQIVMTGVVAVSTGSATWIGWISWSDVSGCTYVSGWSDWSTVRRPSSDRLCLAWQQNRQITYTTSATRPPEASDTEVMANANRADMAE